MKAWLKSMVCASLLLLAASCGKKTTTTTGTAAAASKPKFYLLGTDYVFPRTANKVLKAYLLSVGIPEANIKEVYTQFHHQDYQTIVSDIKAFAAGADACVMSTINGDSNVPFYKEFANQGLTAADCPIMAFSVAEDELLAMDVPPLAGHLAAWNYFQSINTPENKAFVKKFKEYCARQGLPGGMNRVTDDPIEAAYFGVYVWKAAVEKADSFDVDKVRQAVYGLEFDAPGGKKSMHPSNQHTLKPVLIGEIKKDGQFKILFQSDGLVSPDSYSKYLHTDGKFPEPTGGPKPGKTYPRADTSGGTVKIGILHSLSGTMAISETSLRDIVLMAVEEINAAGGVLGKQIEPVVKDPASNWPLFAEKAKELITADKVAVTFGCWTSVSRKSCLPVFEEYNALLFYPVQYEGEEQSLNVFYTAASPNQQLIPAAEYMINEVFKK